MVWNTRTFNCFTGQYYEIAESVISQRCSRISRFFLFRNFYGFVNSRISPVPVGMVVLSKFLKVFNQRRGPKNAKNYNDRGRGGGTKSHNPIHSILRNSNIFLQSLHRKNKDNYIPGQLTLVQLDVCIFEPLHGVPPKVAFTRICLFKIKTKRAHKIWQKNYHLDSTHVWIF